MGDKMKLPVFRAFSATYGFVFSNFLEIVQIVWLPLAIMFAGAYVLVHYYAPILIDIISMVTKVQPGGTGPEALSERIRPLFLLQPILLVASLVLSGIIWTGILRFAVRGERPGTPFYIGFGVDELRVIGTMILVGLATGAIYIGSVLGLLLLVALAGALSESAAAVVAVVGIVAIIVLLLWFMLRMSLASAAAVGTREIGLGPSFSITGGNVFRLALFWVLVFLPLIVLSQLASSLVLGPVFFDGLTQLIRDVSPGIDEKKLAIYEFMSRVFEVVQSRLPVLLLIGFIERLIAVPIIVSAGAVAYRFLTEGDISDER